MIGCDVKRKQMFHCCIHQNDLNTSNQYKVWVRTLYMFFRLWIINKHYKYTKKNTNLNDTNSIKRSEGYLDGTWCNSYVVVTHFSSHGHLYRERLSVCVCVWRCSKIKPFVSKHKSSMNDLSKIVYDFWMLFLVVFVNLNWLYWRLILMIFG